MLGHNNKEGSGVALREIRRADIRKQAFVEQCGNNYSGAKHTKLWEQQIRFLIQSHATEDSSVKYII